MSTFDPSKFGAKPVTNSSQPTSSTGFNPSNFGATPLSSLPSAPSAQPTGDSWWKQAGMSVANPLIGLAKGIGSTLSGMADVGGALAGQTVGRVTNAMMGKGFTAQTPTGVQSNALATPEVKAALQPNGVGQNIGYYGEKVGEFLIPGGAEKGLMTKASSLIDNLPKVLGMTGKAADIFANTLKTAAQTAISGASTAGVTAAQTGDLKQAENAGIMGGVAGGLAKSLETFGGSLGKYLQKSGFKLTPSQEVKTAQKAESAAQFMNDMKITGNSATKYEKLSNVTSDMENAIQTSLPKKLQINKDAIGQYVNQALDTLKENDPAKYAQARKEANTALSILDKGKNTSINLETALKAKRSYGSLAFKQSKVYDPKVVAEGSYAVEQGFQSAINDILNSTNTKINVPKGMENLFGGAKEVTLPDFNKVYSKAISAHNLTKIATSRSEGGLSSRLLGMFAGETFGGAVGGIPGKIVGAGIGKKTAELAPSIGRNLTERGLYSAAKLPGATKVGLGIKNASNQ